MELNFIFKLEANSASSWFLLYEYITVQVNKTFKEAQLMWQDRLIFCIMPIVSGQKFRRRDLSPKCSKILAAESNAYNIPTNQPKI
jgi:nucleoside-specific outer membrane channel protein Tsx